MRGALQPVFGILITSIFFTLLHTQYLFTPTMGLIFLISVGFGVIRRRYNTTTAIITHFVYNFFPLLLLVLSGGRIGS
jgi:membrane protease YdiL (CAAX protease family)